ncbi:hypothetical protein ACLEIY_16180 [Acetobacter tropicalis]|uniref:hypothetical protein n=1 Tax=Acetobacter tropicalis TaxID=104102 RepID=UPI003976B743
MGIFDWFKPKILQESAKSEKTSPQKTGSSDKSSTIKFEVNISRENIKNSPKYIAISPDKRWELRITKSGGNGEFSSFYDDKKVFAYPFQLFTQLPSSPSLSNSGDFCFSHGNFLKNKKAANTSTFYIARDLRIRQFVFEGHYTTTAISDDGKICAVFGSTNEHRSEVALFDSDSGAQVASFFTDSYRLRSIKKILTSEQKIILSNPTLGDFSFEFTGKIENEKSYIDAELHKGTLDIVCARVEKILKHKPAITNPDMLRELLICVDQAPPYAHSNQAWDERQVLRMKVLILEKMKKYQEAYDCAVKIKDLAPTKSDQKKIRSLAQRLSSAQH